MSEQTLWREATGRALRRRRQDRGRTLAQVASRAGVSVQYLSEVERGLKDASSEMLAAILAAQGWDILDLTRTVTDDLERRHGAVDLRSRLSVASRATAAGGARGGVLLAA